MSHAKTLFRVGASLAGLIATVSSILHGQSATFRFELNPLNFGLGNYSEYFARLDTIHRVGDVNADGFDDIVARATICYPPFVANVTDVLVFSGFDGLLVSIIPQTPYCSVNGSDIAGFVDIDLDGRPEILVSRYFSNGTTAIDAISTPSNQVVRGYQQASTFPNFSGSRIAVIGDVDIDGVNDIAVGREYCATCLYSTNVSWGAVDIVSGATGNIIRTHIDPMPTGGQFFGSRVRDGDDLDGDGVGDVIVGSPRGHIVGFSGLTGSIIFQFAFPYLGPANGNTNNHPQVMDFCGVGDVNGDGLGEFAVSWGYPIFSCFGVASAQVPGVVWIVTAATQTIVHQIVGTIGAEAYGYSLDGSSDADGDGIRDLLIGSAGLANLPPQTPCTTSGFVDIVSGRTGIPSLRVFAPSGSGVGASFASTVRWIGDVNQDGFTDLAAARLGGTNGSAALVFTLPPIAPIPLAGGSVSRFGLGGTMDVLRFSHDLAPTPTSGGPGRCVVIPPQANSIFVNMITPPGATSSPNYLLFGCVGTAFGLQPTTLPGGLGETIVPPAFLDLPNPPVPLFPIGDSGGWTGMQLPSLSVGASGTFVLSAPPPSVATTLTIQGLIQDPTEPINGISTTNAVRLVIR